MIGGIGVGVGLGVGVGAGVGAGVAAGAAVEPLSPLQPTVSVTATQLASKTFMHWYFAGFTVRH